MAEQSTLQKMVFWLLGIVLSVIVLKSLDFIFKPLILALFFVFCATPLRLRLERLKIPRALVNALLPLIILSCLVLLGLFVSQNVHGILSKIPEYRVQFEALLEKIVGLIQQRIPSLPVRLQERLSQISMPWEWIGKTLGAGVGSFFAILANGAVVFVFMIFLFIELGSLPERFSKAYGQKRYLDLQNLFTKINQGVLAYIRLKALVSFLVAAISTVIMAFFHVEFWPFWGMLTFFGNFVPYIGSFVAIVFPVLLLLLQTTSLVQAGLLLLFLALTQRLIETFVEPQLAGKALNLSPLILILGFILWTWLWGFVGMVLAVPMLVTIKITLDHLPQTKTFAQLLGASTKP